ncbi:MAG: response regulator, partial [Gallionella sp.]|nr:response regulator [Gallionella sp.]
HTQGFLVKAVDNILRLDWSAMRVPPAMLMAEMGGMVTAITELKDKRLVMLLDVEKVLAETGHFDSDELIFKSVQPITQQNRTVFFADDSSVARNQISRTLDAMHVKHLSAINGRQAWVELAKMADYAESANLPLKNLLQVILTDVEMPEMDGYMLTRKIKADKRFNGIPVLMHSSLSSASNKQLGKSVGVDEYVPKFEPQKLSQTLARLLA